MSLSLGVLVLSGWHLKIPSIIQIHPDWVPMQYNTALGFLLSGIGLWAADGNYRLGVWAAGGTISLIGLLTLIEHLYGIDLRIDQLFMQHYITVATPQPGRMAPNTALCFLLTGIALVQSGFRGCYLWSLPTMGLLSALIFGLATVALTGYLVGMPTAYGWGNLTRMAPHTAVGFMVLGCGLLALATQTMIPDRDWRPAAIGIAVVTITISLWQALRAAKSRSEAPAEELVLGFGLLMALALAYVVAYSIRTQRAIEAAESALNSLSKEIANRKLAEQQLRIAAITFESHEGMVVTNGQNVILRVNKAFTTITGYSAEEVIGQSLRLLDSDRQEKEFYIAMWDKIDDIGAWEGEIWNRRKSGEDYPAHLTITAVKDDTGIITNYVTTLTDITLSKAASDEIENLAFYDPLTQLPNRRLLLDRLKQALAASTRNSQRGALLFLDLDHFKNLNDTLGHDVGDLLLQQVAERLISCVREGDTVARLGGDEFVVLIEDLSEHVLEAAAQTKNIGEKILAELNKSYMLVSHKHHSTPSIGVTLFNDQHAGVDALLKQADLAMYDAKASGRNALRFYDPKMQEAINTRIGIEAELHKALELEQFQLHYQIQVDSIGQATGAEALIRWQHPDRGMISPAHFIPLAEETGLILSIGKWVLEAGCAQLKLWQQEPVTRDLTLSINVSAKQFRQMDFVEQVQTVVQRHNLDPTKLKLELTESMLVDSIKNIIDTMNALGKMGIKFSLDDFGTGFSSLQYLKKLPLNQLKIDRSFIRDLTTDSSDKAIVRTIIAMARGLNLDVIAEGVETDSQLAYLRNYGCDHFQGYLFSKPVPIDQFGALLRKS